MIGDEITFLGNKEILLLIYNHISEGWPCIKPRAAPAGTFRWYQAVIGVLVGLLLIGLIILFIIIIRWRKTKKWLKEHSNKVEPIERASLTEPLTRADPEPRSRRKKRNRVGVEPPMELVRSITKFI